MVWRLNPRGVLPLLAEVYRHYRHNACKTGAWFERAIGHRPSADELCRALATGGGYGRGKLVPGGGEAKFKAALKMLGRKERERAGT